jgi:hypothetical protein
MIDDITGFFSPSFLPIRWRYQRFHTRSNYPNVLDSLPNKKAPAIIQALDEYRLVAD